MSHVPHDELVWRAALRATDDDEHGRHLVACATCADALADVQASMRVVEPDAPPERLWRRIAQAAMTPPRPRVRLLVAACVVTAVVSAGAVGTASWMLERASAGVEGPAIALEPLDGAAGEASAWIVDRDGSRVLVVDAHGRTPPPQTSYEVWLVDADADGMVHLGTLVGSSTRLPVPPDVGLDAFPIVEVSLEPLDGDPGHGGVSVWRGSFD